MVPHRLETPAPRALFGRDVCVWVGGTFLLTACGPMGAGFTGASPGYWRVKLAVAPLGAPAVSEEFPCSRYGMARAYEIIG